MLWIGLTGGIATGKSTAAGVLRNLGIPVIDADVLAHEELQPGCESFTEIVQEFGQEVLLQNGTINRNELARIVFSDEMRRIKLEQIIHPKVQSKVRSFKLQQEQAGQLIAIYDVPLLFEKKLESQFDGVLLIDCNEKLQVERLIQRNQITIDEARLRLAAQLDMKLKRQKANWVIENNLTKDDLKKQITIWLSSLGMNVSHS